MRPSESVTSAQDDDGAGDEGQHEEHVELLEFLFGAGHGAERGGDAGVEDVAEQEEEDEEADLRGRDGEFDACGEEAGFDDDRAGDDPDADLGETDGADSEDLAGHHLFGADGGEEDFEDARGLLFDDGAGDVHAVEAG